MGSWTLETIGTQSVLAHRCEAARSCDGNELLTQDLGGGYVRCSRCGEKYLPEMQPGNPRILLRLVVPTPSGPLPLHG